MKTLFKILCIVLLVIGCNNSQSNKKKNPYIQRGHIEKIELKELYFEEKNYQNLGPLNSIKFNGKEFFNQDNEVLLRYINGDRCVFYIDTLSTNIFISRKIRKEGAEKVLKLGEDNQFKIEFKPKNKRIYLFEYKEDKDDYEIVNIYNLTKEERNKILKSQKK